MDKIGVRIQKYRKDMNISQHQFAEMTGLSTNYISAIERGVKIPRLETFIKIANSLDVSADYLLMDVLDQGKSLVANEITECTKELNKDQIQIVLDVVKTLVASLHKNTHSYR